MYVCVDIFKHIIFIIYIYIFYIIIYSILLYILYYYIFYIIIYSILFIVVLYHGLAFTTSPTSWFLTVGTCQEDDVPRQDDGRICRPPLVSWR